MEFSDDTLSISNFCVFPDKLRSVTFIPLTVATQLGYLAIVISFKENVMIIIGTVLNINVFDFYRFSTDIDHTPVQRKISIKNSRRKI